jgi:succinate dehydrogenase/fumarate reductase flavoprotein subunit
MKAKKPHVPGGLSRRDFIKGAAAGAIGVAAAGTLAACENPANTEYIEVEPDWLGKEPEIAESQITGTVNADVVVVGAGLAGVCAARKASDDGAKVVLIEKAAQAMCRSGEYAVLGGAENARIGRPDVDPNVVTDRFMQECEFRIKRPIVSRWAQEAHTVFDWFIAAKSDLYKASATREAIPDANKDAFLVPLAYPQPVLYDYRQEEFPTYPSSFEFRPSQEPVVAANVKKCQDNGVTELYGHFAEKLEKTNGRVSGVIVRDAGTNQYKRITASKGVILATGDNANDQTILDHFVPALKVLGISGIPMMGMDVEGKPINTGDGLRLAAWIGGKVQNNHAPMTHHMGAGIGITPFLLLNKAGKRFMNESVPGQQVQNQLELQPDYTAYQIFDAGWPGQLQYMPANHGACCYYDNSLPKNNEEDRQYMSDAKFAAAVANGQIKTANSLSGLLDQLDIDKAAAQASIDRYNALARGAEGDLDYDKPASRMFEIKTAPYYACTFGMAGMLVCIGGIESDEEARAYDTSLNPIPGLYVAGNVQGARFAVEYPICMRGISHSMAMFYGYIAGKNAAAKLT